MGSASRRSYALGFVVGPGRVATAFQAIDGALRLEVELADHSKLNCDEVWAANRLPDWALLKVDTRQMPSLRVAQENMVPVGERYLVRDGVAWIYSLWQKKDKNGKGVVSARLYDSRNRMLVGVVPKKISLSEAAPLRVAFDVALEKLSPGVYRVDILWNEQPAWRTFFSVTD